MNGTTYTNGSGESFTADEVNAKYGIPPHVVASLFRYLNDRIGPGGFLTYVLSNDLFGAVSTADEHSLAGLPGLVRFIYCRVDSRAHGSPEKFRAWLKGLDINDE